MSAAGDIHKRFAKAVGVAVAQYLGALASLLLPRRPRPAIVLEARAGEWAVAAFAVANHRAHSVAAPLTLSTFRDRRGAPAPVDVCVEPALLQLGAAQQAVVRIGAAVDERMEPATDYLGFVNIAGLADQPLPVIVRRSKP
jgi:hypothetical protein